MMKKMYLYLSFFFIFSETKPWVQAAQFAVDIFGGIARGIAEAKLRNEELKRENASLVKKIVITEDNSKIQINNLFSISTIKEDFSQRVNDYKDNHIINLDDMNVVIANLYRSYISLNKQFVNKCKMLLKKGISMPYGGLLQILIRISLVAMKSAFSEYISLLESYNFESQNLVQIMLTNNMKENIFQKISIKKSLIDPNADLKDFLNTFDAFLDKNDETIGNLLTTKKLLQDNIILTFNRQTKDILETLEKIEEGERLKEIAGTSGFGDITNSLDLLKEKLFQTFDNVNESTNNLENFLFKMIFVFQVNTNKLQIIINFMNKLEDGTIIVEKDFIDSLKKDFIKNKDIIEKNKNLYIDEILKYQKPLQFFKNIATFFTQAQKDIKKIDTSLFQSIIREYKKLILEQELAYGKFVEKIKDQFSQLFYINQVIGDIEDTIDLIRQEKETLKGDAGQNKKNSGEDKNKDILIVNNVSIVDKQKITSSGRHKNKKSSMSRTSGGSLSNRKSVSKKEGRSHSEHINNQKVNHSQEKDSSLHDGASAGKKTSSRKNKKKKAERLS
jgi:hypothetical protein